MARSDAKYAIADRFDEAKGEYVGLKIWAGRSKSTDSEALLVRGLDTPQTQLSKTTPAAMSGSGNAVNGRPVKATGDSTDPKLTGETEAPLAASPFLR